MAITKQITKTVYGKELNFADSYIKVESVSGTKYNMDYEVVVACEKEGEVLNTFSETFVPTLDGSNFITQAYEHLKTLPEFSDAVDC